MTTVKETLMQDAPASVETTYTLSVGGRFEGMIEDPSDADWVRVTLTAGRSYDIRLKGTGPDGVVDTVLKLYNPVGEELAYNDDIDTAAREVDSILEFSPDATGVYYVSASGYPYPGEEQTGSYVITVSDEADNNPDTLWTVSAGGRFNGTLDDKFDEDWIRVELVAGKTYGITLTGIGPDVDTDTILRIYNPAGDQVAFHDDVDYAAGKVNSRLTFSPAATGEYYISAGAYRGNPTRDYSGRYQVTVFDEADRDGLTLTGTAGDDAYFRALVGGPGDDALDGKAGDDWLEGGPGADRLTGGAGADTARYTYSDAGVSVNLHDGTARGGHAEGDTFAGINAIRYVDAGGHTREVQVPDIENLHGSPYDDILTGAHGPNDLRGYLGDDVLDGRAGNDNLVGGAGADELRGGGGIDWVRYFSSDAGVVVKLHDGTARGGHAEGDTFPGTVMVEYTDAEGNPQMAELPDIENLSGSDHADILAGDLRDNQLFGRVGNDELDGRQGDDLLWGGVGNDELDGGEGDDFLVGDPGADRLIGGGGSDWVSYYLSDAGVVVRLHEGTVRGGHAEGDTFPGTVMVEYTDAEGNPQMAELPDIENLVGSDHADILAGDLRDNWLNGGPGDDTLYGGPGGGDDLLQGEGGNDRLFGGPGSDTLVGGPGDDLLRGGPGDDWLLGDAGDDTYFFAPDSGDDTVLDFDTGGDKIDLTAFPEIQSTADFDMEQQGNNLIINLSGQGGGTVTLYDIGEVGILDTHFIV